MTRKIIDATVFAVVLVFASGTAGAETQFVDNGDGTISDRKTGLMWERLNDGGGINDKDAQFIWMNAFDKVKVLNGDATGCIDSGNPSSCCTGAGKGSGCTAFAGYTDWRLPGIDALQSIMDNGMYDPAVPTAFSSGCSPNCTECSCTQSSFYWSATGHASLPINAYGVYFLNSFLNIDPKSNKNYVRAVRSGP